MEPLAIDLEASEVYIAYGANQPPVRAAVQRCKAKTASALGSNGRFQALHFVPDILWTRSMSSLPKDY